MSALTRDANPPLTKSVEDYLKVIYHLSSQGGFATTSDIAGMLEVAPPSVSGMVKRLSDTGLIEHVPVVRGDVCDQALLERALGEHEINTVIHLAAQTIVPSVTGEGLDMFCLA